MLSLAECCSAAVMILLPLHQLRVNPELASAAGVGK